MTDVELQRSCLARLVQVDGQWLVSSPALDRVTRAPCVLVDSAPLLCELLAGAGMPCRRSVMVEEIRRCGVTEAEQLLQAIIDSGLLVEPGAEGPWVAAAGTPAEPLARFLACGRTLRFLDYADGEAFVQDRTLMERYLEVEDDPIRTRLRDAPSIRLRHPALGPADDLGTRIGHLLFAGFGVVRRAVFLELLTVDLKPVPSKGARHPFYAALLIGETGPFERGSYLYLPDEHALGWLGTSVEADRAPIRLAMLASYDRVQWRYRDSLAYKDVLLDMGHVTETLTQAAAALDLELQAVETLEAFDRPLLLEALAAYTIGPR